nr:UDP-N-acetylglucosamine--N-acetylmuramyl-(pentapeptide) pyrophosphoryl-undecaprenol N-acetylglucosamine transferase-like isoform X1 [Ipomoea batatas]
MGFMATISHSSPLLHLQTHTSIVNSSPLFFQNIHILHRKIRFISCPALNKPNNAAAVAATSGSDTLRIIFAAGGTGGHIYPAVAIADELKAINPSMQALFVGMPGGMESAAVPAAGYSFAPVPASPLARPFFSPYNFFILPFLLINSLLKCFQLLQVFKPQIVVGTGGFVSFPICLAAALGGVKLVIQEQNAAPGIANRVLSLFAHKIFLAFDSSIECFWQKKKCVVCGNPVRSSLKRNVPKEVARQHFFPDLEGKGKVVLVLGGSLGANTINVKLLNLYSNVLDERKDLFLIWQTGVEAFHEIQSLVNTHPRLVLTPFLHVMDLAYAAADLIISRSGAMTCYEILATGKPCILIPSPNVAEGHQLKNACLMAKLAGARVITENELDSFALRSAAEEILGDESLMADMSERALKAAKLDASAEISKHILSLVNFSAISCENS